MKTVLCLAAALLQHQQNQQQQHREAHEKLDMLERSQLRESRERLEALQQRERHDAATLTAQLLEALAASNVSEGGGGGQSVRGSLPEKYYIGDAGEELGATGGEGQAGIFGQLEKLLELLGAASAAAVDPMALEGELAAAHGSAARSVVTENALAVGLESASESMAMEGEQAAARTTASTSEAAAEAVEMV